MNENERIELLCDIAGYPLSILCLLWIRRKPMSVSDVADQFGIDRDTASKHLWTLHVFGLVSHPNARSWAIVPAMMGQLMLLPLNAEILGIQKEPLKPANAENFRTQGANAEILGIQPPSSSSLVVNNNNDALCAFLRSINCGSAISKFAESGRSISVDDARREYQLFLAETQAHEHNGHIKLLRWRFNEIAANRRDPPAAVIETRLQNMGTLQTKNQTASLAPLGGVDWHAVKNAMRDEMRYSAWATWLRDTEAVSVSDDAITVRCPRAFIAEYCEARLREIAERVIRQRYARAVTVRFVSPVEVGV